MSIFSRILHNLHIRHRHPAQPPEPQGAARHAHRHQPPPPVILQPPSFPLAGLPRHQRPEMRDVATQTSPGDFAPIYQQVDHAEMHARREAELANQRFEAEIHQARQKYGGKVQFREVRQGGVTLGYVVSSPAQGARPGSTKPMLYLVGDGSVSQTSPQLRPRAPIVQLHARAGDTDNLAQASVVRRGNFRSIDLSRASNGFSPFPNYVVGTQISPLHAARFLSNAGKSSKHKHPVEVFVAAPGAEPHVSTLNRLLNPGRYSTMVFAQA